MKRGVFVKVPSLIPVSDYTTIVQSRSRVADYITYN